MDTLHALIRSAQQGDALAFNHIVERFQNMAYATAYSMLGNVHLAEDVAQDAFIEAFLNLSNLREPEAFPGWFRRIIVRQGDRALRGKQLSLVSLETAMAYDASGVEQSPEQCSEDGEVRQVVHHAVQTLPEHERVVVLLFYGNGYSLKEIGAFLEIPLSTVKKRLFDARKHLKSSLTGVLHELVSTQSWAPHLFPARVQLLIAIRMGDLAGVKDLIDRVPMLVGSKWGRNNNDSARWKLAVQPGHTALHEASINGHLAIVQLLLDYGAYVDARSSIGATPLHVATSSRHVQVVEALLARGAQVNAALVTGLTPLHLAVMKEFVDIATVLLTHNADVNVAARSGRTPLHWAALKGHQELIQLLLDYQADRQRRDELGRTPLDWALARGHDELAACLDNYSAV